MHDVGKLILIHKDPEMYDGAVELAFTEKLDLDRVECEAFGASHAEVGSYLLWLWGLPGPITEAVAFHHRPPESLAHGPSAALFVHAADALAHEAEGEGSVPAAPLNEPLLRAAGFGDRLDRWRELAREAPVGNSP
jgi:HD-like signal output (HDOD) protein